MKRMNYPIAAIVFLLGFLVQSTVLWRFPFLGYSANVLLCLVVVFTYLYRKDYALIYGLSFGVLFDITTQQYVGAQTISFFAVFLLLRLLGHIFNPEKTLPSLLFSAGATLLNGLLLWLVYKMGGSPVHFSAMLVSLPALFVSNGILVVLLHRLFVRSIIRFHRDRKFNGEAYS